LGPPSLASASSIPPSGVTDATSARYDADTGSSQAGPGPFTGDLSDIEGASAQVSGAPPGPVRSFAQGGGFGGVPDVGAIAMVEQVSNWQPAGASGAVDVDLTISLDGSLSVDFFGFFDAGAMQAKVGLLVEVITESGGATQVFNADATLQNGDRSFDVEFFAAGDWDASDWTVTSGGATKGAASLDFATVLDDVVLVAAGELFALRTTLTTEADLDGAFEQFARSDFFSTGSVELGTDAPGVTFTFVPEPGTAVLVGVGAALVGLRRRPRRG
jgi:hypothetical protein